MTRAVAIEQNTAIDSSGYVSNSTHIRMEC